MAQAQQALRRNGRGWVGEGERPFERVLLGVTGVGVGAGEPVGHARGETEEFQGHAQNIGQEERKITGRATPEDTKRGKIKVRIFVTEKIQLIFNTTYQFED